MIFHHVSKVNSESKVFGFISLNMGSMTSNAVFTPNAPFCPSGAKNIALRGVFTRPDVSNNELGMRSSRHLPRV